MPNDNVAMAEALEKLAGELEARAELEQNKTRVSVKTASTEYGSLDSRTVRGSDVFTDWLLG